MLATEHVVLLTLLILVGIVTAGMSWTWMKIQSKGHILENLKTVLGFVFYKKTWINDTVARIEHRSLFHKYLETVLFKCQYCNVVWLNMLACVMYACIHFRDGPLIETVYTLIAVFPITGVSFLILKWAGTVEQ